MGQGKEKKPDLQISQLYGYVFYKRFVLKSVMGVFVPWLDAHPYMR